MPSILFLTERERSIVQLMADQPGIENLELSARLRITEGTVKVYLSRIFTKTGKLNRTALTVWAIKQRDKMDHV